MATHMKPPTQVPTATRQSLKRQKKMPETTTEDYGTRASAHKDNYFRKYFF